MGNQGPQTKDMNRVELIRALAQLESQEDIAKVLGISRQRVNQIMRRHGIQPRDRHLQKVDPRKMLAAARRAYGMADACQMAGVSQTTMHRALESLGCLEACHRLWRWRRRYRREEMLDALRDLARRLCRTPGQRDINNDPYTPAHTLYTRNFGTLRAAQEAAGLPPNRRGGSQRPNPEVCLRGHPLTAADKRTVKRGKGTYKVYDCRVCRRLRRRK